MAFLSSINRLISAVLADTAAAVDHYKFKLIRFVQLIQRRKFTLSADKHELYPPIAATRIAYSITKYSISQNQN